MEVSWDRLGSKAFFLAITAVICSVMGCGGHRIGVHEGMLMPCPNSPNCVSSDETRRDYFVKPFQFPGSPDKARKAILSVLNSMPRVSIVKADSRYIHAEFRSRVFRFVDDLEFYFDDQVPLIHVRSASRTGYSDFGVNRRRVEEIRARFLQLMMDSSGGNK